MRPRIPRVALGVAVALGLVALLQFQADSGAPVAPQLHVAGNSLVDASGGRVILHGVDVSGAEYDCVNGWGVFPGPAGQAAVSAMLAWDVNAVRIPLNEACWNGAHYVHAAYSGTDYRRAIEGYVHLLNANGLVAILDLHWSAGLFDHGTDGCPSAEAVCQKPMPDLAGSVRFWTSVAKSFKGNDSVIFDLFNEPYPDLVLPEPQAWECWRDGGRACSPGIHYAVAGMQRLVNAVRATGASNVIMLGGLAHANDLSQWLRYEPGDPDHDLVASWHSYSFNACDQPACWRRDVTPVIRTVPVVAGEIGQHGCGADYIDQLTRYLDTSATSYLAWGWNAHFSCAGSHGLITSYSGDPTAYGRGYRAHLWQLAAGPVWW